MSRALFYRKFNNLKIYFSSVRKGFTVAHRTIMSIKNQISNACATSIVDPKEQSNRIGNEITVRFNTLSEQAQITVNEPNTSTERKDNGGKSSQEALGFDRNSKPASDADDKKKNSSKHKLTAEKFSSKCTDKKSNKIEEEKNSSFKEKAPKLKPPLEPSKKTQKAKDVKETCKTVSVLDKVHHVVPQETIVIEGDLVVHTKGFVKVCYTALPGISLIC